MSIWKREISKQNSKVNLYSSLFLYKIVTGNAHNLNLLGLIFEA